MDIDKTHIFLYNPRPNVTPVADAAGMGTLN